MKARVAAGDGKIHMAARVRWLGFEGEAVAVTLFDAVFAEKIDRLAEALDGFDGVLRRVAFDAFAASPEDVRLAPNSAPRSMARIVF